jgi:hypothetical protein
MLIFIEELEAARGMPFPACAHETSLRELQRPNQRCHRAISVRMTFPAFNPTIGSGLSAPAAQACGCLVGQSHGTLLLRDLDGGLE